MRKVFFSHFNFIIDIVEYTIGNLEDEHWYLRKKKCTMVYIDAIMGEIFQCRLETQNEVTVEQNASGIQNNLCYFIHSAI